MPSLYLHAASLAALTGRDAQAWRHALRELVRASDHTALQWWPLLCDASPAARGWVLRQRALRAVIVAGEVLPPGGASAGECRVSRVHAAQCDSQIQAGECR